MIQKILILSIVITSLTLGRLVIPEDGAMLNYIHILFEWEQETNSEAYELEVSEDALFTSQIIHVIDSSLVFIAEDYIEWEKTYFWRVRPTHSESWIDTNSFSTASTISNVEVIYIDDEYYSEGVTIFGAFFGYYSAIFDEDGKEIWNTGEKDIVYYNSDYYGQLFGCWLNNDSENNLPGVEFNLDNEFLWEEPNDEFLHHELFQLPNGNYLGIVEERKSGHIPIGSWTGQFRNLGFVADGITQEFSWVGDRIVEWDLEGVEVWSWSAFDSYSMEDYDSLGGTWIEARQKLRYDWTHINALGFQEEDSSIYVSSRHLSRITKIKWRSDTEKPVVWNMGHDMPSGDVTFGHDLGFSFQHSIQVLENGNILILDNGNLSQYFRGTSEPITRALEIQVNKNNDNYSSEIFWEYGLSEDLFGFASGNVQKLKNGNYLVTTVGGTGTILEITPDKNVIWEAKLNLTIPSGAVYRANRIPGLYPVSFSIISPDFILNNPDGSENNNEEEQQLQFYVVNEGSKQETFLYVFDDHSGLFEDVSDTIIIDKNEKKELVFGNSGSSGETNFTFELSIIPIHKPELEKTICYPSCAVSVYPGDTDNNGIVDEFDILPIGIYFNKVGSQRESTSFTWNQFMTARWDSVPITYADANGDGRVDGRDIIGIGVNWGNIHDNTINSYKIEEEYNFSKIEKDNLYSIYRMINGSGESNQEIRQLLEKILQISTPSEFQLLQNYPNPFNSQTAIVLKLPEEHTVSIKIFDLLGREVFVLSDNVQYPAGTHTINLNSKKLTSGIYFYQVQAGNFFSQKKMVILK